MKPRQPMPDTWEMKATVKGEKKENCDDLETLTAEAKEVDAGFDFMPERGQKRSEDEGMELPDKKNRTRSRVQVSKIWDSLVLSKVPSLVGHKKGGERRRYEGELNLAEAGPLQQQQSRNQLFPPARGGAFLEESKKLNKKERERKRDDAKEAAAAQRKGRSHGTPREGKSCGRIRFL